MQIHRLISLLAAVLVTVFIVRFFTEETYEEPRDATHDADRR